jgi:hypothetical protein
MRVVVPIGWRQSALRVPGTRDETYPTASNRRGPHGGSIRPSPESFAKGRRTVQRTHDPRPVRVSHFTAVKWNRALWDTKDLFAT